MIHSAANGTRICNKGWGKLMIKGLIFDLDGVICYTDKYHYRAWKQIADKLEIPFDEKVNDRLRGVSRMESLNIILEASSRVYTEEEKIRLAEEKNDIYRVLLQQMTPADLSEQVKVTLEELKARGYRLAIGSSSKNARMILERIGLGAFFHAISDGNNIKNSKPDPEVFRCAAQMIELDPSQCIVVEDAPAGLEAAIAGKFCAVGLGDAVADCEADYHIGQFGELMSIDKLQTFA